MMKTRTSTFKGREIGGGRRGSFVWMASCLAVRVCSNVVHGLFKVYSVLPNNFFGVNTYMRNSSDAK